MKKILPKSIVDLVNKGPTMNHERPPSPEREQGHELPAGVFGLEKISPQQIAGLVEAINEAETDPDWEERKTATPAAAISELGLILSRDLEQLAEQLPDKAAEVYFTLVGTDNKWTKSSAVLHMATPLVWHYGADPEKRQHILDTCVRMLEDREELVRSVAGEILNDLIEDQFFDDPAKVAIVEKMQEANRSVRRRLGGME
ncbi:hypothetical protein FXN61_00535 [Lentzea sp. PSKA42]|uniref:HEAT repeat-containing protein n=1 Tax=Lentzea indica TaxID=2604800 RepID=A0ABX1F917_9PSEU|nr:hypothetical protein [Lentzea indica]NKE55394.1 hypothetical protein [Lentzea indica]